MTTTRRKVLASAAPALALAGTAPVSTALANARPHAAGHPDVDALVDRAARGHAALMQGDLDRYFSQLQTSEDFTLMAPFGGRPTRGSELSAERWAAVGRFFKHGRDSTLELVQAYRSPELVVLASIERTVAEVGGLAAMPWALRVTLVFRRDAGQWRLVHRHADPLVEAISVQQSAALASRPAS